MNCIAHGTAGTIGIMDLTVHSITAQCTRYSWNYRNLGSNCPFCICPYSNRILNI